MKTRACMCVFNGNPDPVRVTPPYGAAAVCLRGAGSLSGRLGGVVGGLEDNWRSLSVRPPVDPCRSGGQSYGSVEACSRPLRGTVQAGVGGEFGVTPPCKFIFQLWRLMGR